MSVIARAAKHTRCPFARRAPGKATIGRMAAEVRRLEQELAEASQRLDRLEGAPPARRDGRIPLEELIPGATLCRVWLVDRDLRGVRLMGSDLSCALACRADFTAANLAGAVMTGIEAVDASFNGADLNGCDLQSANLYTADLRGAVLTGANLYGARLAGAVYDESTVWPESFDPAALGAEYLGAEVLA